MAGFKIIDKEVNNFMENLYWVGIKESEIRSCKDLFAGSITYNGSGKDGNISYTHIYGEILNYNNDSSKLDSFMRNTLLDLIEEIPDIKFMFYTPYYAYFLGEEITCHTICLNEQSVLSLLRDKLKSRLWLANTIPVLSTIALPGIECLLPNLKKAIPGCDSFILQGCTGAGGNDTYAITQNSWNNVFNKLNNHDIYLLSPNLQPSYSVNIHVLIGKNIVFTSPSIQIIENEDDRMVYHGADFIEYRNVPIEIKNKILGLSKQIGEKIQCLGYKGVLGIDYLIEGNAVYFLEINPRFQASTPLINLALASTQSLTIQEILLNIFYEQEYLIPEPKMTVNYSTYIIDATKNNSFYSQYLQNINASNEVEEVLSDGYYNDIRFENKASLFSLVLATNIVTINPNGNLNIHENIRPYKKCIPNPENKLGFLKLKSQLLVQGIHFSPNVYHFLIEKGMRRGTYSSIDLYFSKSLIINCPLDLKLCSISPFRVDYENNELNLFYADCKISKVFIDSGIDYRDLKTKNSVLYGDISFLATDRLRIHHSLGCAYKTIHKGCMFCDVPASTSSLKIEDIYEVIDWHLKNSYFDHILIGGGSSVRDLEPSRVLSIIQYIRKHTDKDIYLMSLPPQKPEILSEYFQAGLDEIALNIEIFDREQALKIMPHKGSISLSEYQNALTHAVKLWGNTGKVKSLLVYGLETDNSFLSGVHWLASHGIQPIISVFRPLRNTKMWNRIPPESSSLQKIYFDALSICQCYNLYPGPECLFCQNNTLSIPIDMFLSLYNLNEHYQEKNQF